MLPSLHVDHMLHDPGLKIFRRKNYLDAPNFWGNHYIYIELTKVMVYVFKTLLKFN